MIEHCCKVDKAATEKLKFKIKSDTDDEDKDQDPKVPYTLLRDENGKTVLHLSSICDLVSHSELGITMNIPLSVSEIISQFAASVMTLRLDTSMIQSISCASWSKDYDVDRLFDARRGTFCAKGGVNYVEILINLSDKNHVETNGRIGGGDGFVITEIGMRSARGGRGFGTFTAPVQSTVIWAFYDNAMDQECIAQLDTKDSREAKYDFSDNRKWIKARRTLVALSTESTLGCDAEYFWIKVVPL